MNENILLEVKGLKKYFPVYSGFFSKLSGQVKAVDDISFIIHEGETLGVVGESGCGKTTAGRTVIRLIEPTAGQVMFKGQDIMTLEGDHLKRMRKEMQIIFQDPYASLNPRKTVLEIVGEGLEIHGIAKGKEKEQRVAELIQKVGLSARYINRYPHEFSGGQRQRIGVARAIALSPSLIICDEPVSALDVSIQAQVINLLIDLREEMNLSYMFVSHGLHVVKHISHRIMVMYLGKIAEIATRDDLFRHPLHPYTVSLLSANPVADPRVHKKRIVLTGDVPSPLNPPAGCYFHPRCPFRYDRCDKEDPPLKDAGNGHFYKCFLDEEGKET
jgi:oligopeptide transport system ATP-binding protein